MLKKEKRLKIIIIHIKSNRILKYTKYLTNNYDQT